MAVIHQPAMNGDLANYPINSKGEDAYVSGNLQEEVKLILKWNDSAGTKLAFALKRNGLRFKSQTPSYDFQNKSKQTFLKPNQIWPAPLLLFSPLKLMLSLICKGLFAYYMPKYK